MTHIIRSFIGSALFVATVSARLLAAERIEIVWPTPSTAWAEGKPIAAFLQQAGSGDPATGGFGVAGYFPLLPILLERI